MDPRKIDAGRYCCRPEQIQIILFLNSNMNCNVVMDRSRIISRDGITGIAIEER
jgi:hypothetical protein